MAKETKKLPYEFDLFYDIKTIDELKSEFAYVTKKQEHLLLLIKEYNIPINIKENK